MRSIIHQSWSWISNDWRLCDITLTRLISQSEYSWLYLIDRISNICWNRAIFTVVSRSVAFLSNTNDDHSLKPATPPHPLATERAGGDLTRGAAENDQQPSTPANFIAEYQILSIILNIQVPEFENFLALFVRPRNSNSQQYTTLAICSRARGADEKKNLEDIRGGRE